MTLEDRLVALAGRLGAVLGLEQDWAAQLTGLLNAPQAILAATQTVPGIIRRATAAEALAGTDDSAALTALGLAGATEVRRYANITALLNGAGSARDGMLAVMPAQSTGNGLLLASVWKFIGSFGKWIPALPLQATTVGVLTDIKGWGSTVGTTFYARDTYIRVTRDAANAAAGWDEYVWIGPSTGWFIWRGAVAPSFASGYQDYATNTAVTVNGDEATAGIAVTRTDGGVLATYNGIVTLPATARPYQERVFGGGASAPSAGWYLANWALQNTGVCLLLATSAAGGPAPTVAEGSITFRRQVPTS